MVSNNVTSGSDPSVTKFTQFKFLIISFLLIVGLLPGLFGLAAIYEKSKNELIASKGFYFKEVAKFTAYQIETTLKEKLSTIDRLARLPIVNSILISPHNKKKSNINNFKRVIEPEMANKGIIFKIYNTSGEAVFNSEIIYPEIDIGKISTLKNMAEIDKKYVSDVIDPPEGESHYFIEIYSPIMDEKGENIGSIQAKYIVDQLFDTIKNTKIGDTGHANLVISSGLILVCPIFTPKKHRISDNLLNTITSGSGWQVVDDDGHGGHGSLVGYSSVNLNKAGLHPDSFGKKEWFVYTRQEPSETFKPLNDFRKAVILYAILLVALVLALGFFGFRQIMKAQKAHQAEVIHREKTESIRRYMDSFQEMMFDPLDEFGTWIDEIDARSGSDKTALVKIKKIRHYLSSIDSLIDQLRYYTKTNDISFEPVDLNNITDSSISLLDYMITKKNISVTRVQPDGRLPLLGQPKLLNIVILNIVLNAIHALGENGEIKVVIEKNSDWAVCKISDNGKGIPKEVIDHIYDPFFSTKKGHKNYGLGLSVSRGIIEEHGGSISVESTEGKGTEVTIKLKLNITEPELNIREPLHTSG
ncbi:MAG: ATP-binding protein [Nitrospinota bacterium]